MSKKNVAKNGSATFIPLTQEDADFVADLLLMPEKQQKFIGLLFRIGNSRLLTDDEFIFFVDYLHQQDVTIDKLQDELAAYKNN